MKWNLVFKLAAFWNFSGALFALCCKDLLSGLFYNHGSIAGGGCMRWEDSFEASLNYYLLYSFILVMGIGYWIVSIDPSKNKGVIVIGIIGKLIAAFSWIAAFFMGQGTILLLGGALGDLTWSLLFCYFFYQSAKKT